MCVEPSDEGVAATTTNFITVLSGYITGTMPIESVDYVASIQLVHSRCEGSQFKDNYNGREGLKERSESN